MSAPFSDHRRRLLRLLAVTAGSLPLTGPVLLPSVHAGPATPTASGSDGPATLRIGCQQDDINLLVLRATGPLERRLSGTRVQWRAFEDAAQLSDAMANGTVDFGLLGGPAAAVAQAAAPELAYVGVEPPRPDGIAVLAPWRSRLRGVQDLRGRRVAVQRHSSAHDLLLRVLDQSGLRWQDIEAVDLPPTQARRAFDRQVVDAWAIGDPFYAATELDAGPRVLATAHGLAGGHAFYLASRRLADAHPRSIAILFEELARADRLVQERRLDAVHLVAEAGALPPEVVAQLLRRRPASRVAPLSDTVVAAQQQLADRFWQHGLLARPLRVADAVWRPAGQPTPA